MIGFVRIHSQNNIQEHNIENSCAKLVVCANVDSARPTYIGQVLKIPTVLVHVIEEDGKADDVV